MRESARGGRAVLWSRLADRGCDRCALWPTDDGWRLDGVVLLPVDGAPVIARYRVQTDESWRTREATVSIGRSVEDGTPGEATPEGVRLWVEGDGRWWIERPAGGDRRQGPAAVKAVAGFVDVDLGLTPATNTLPIRRLGLAPGEAADVDAAWMRWPDLAIEPLPQRYTRLDERRYRYESGNGAFERILTVDDLGLVVSYPDFWERIAASGVGSRKTEGDRD